MPSTGCSGKRGNRSRVFGSLNYENVTIDEDQTYILENYEVECSGYVNAWEFCYQAQRRSEVTFYPGIWKKTGNEFSLNQSNMVTFVPNGDIFSCQVFNLSVNEQFPVSKGYHVGLYSGGALLLTDKSDDVTVYQVRGNQSNFRDDVTDNNYNIAIKVYIGEHICILSHFMHKFHNESMYVCLESFA